jgi:hypothetical protein
MKLLGLVLMTDAKATDKEDHPLQRVEKQALKSPDAHVVQNANGQQLQAALKAKPVESESIKNARSISLHELVEKQEEAASESDIGEYA